MSSKQGKTRTVNPSEKKDSTSSKRKFDSAAASSSNKSPCLGANTSPSSRVTTPQRSQGTFQLANGSPNQPAQLNLPQVKRLSITPYRNALTFLARAVKVEPPRKHFDSRVTVHRQKIVFADKFTYLVAYMHTDVNEDPNDPKILEGYTHAITNFRVVNKGDILIHDQTEAELAHYIDVPAMILDVIPNVFSGPASKIVDLEAYSRSTNSIVSGKVTVLKTEAVRQVKGQYAKTAYCRNLTVCANYTAFILTLWDNAAIYTTLMEGDQIQLHDVRVGSRDNTPTLTARFSDQIKKALDIYVEKCLVSRAVYTNLRAEKAPLPEYLFSRSIAGCTAEHLIQGIETVTEGQVYGRFFCFYPEREVDILHWLGNWIKIGAVPILTLNLQKAVPQGWEIPDAWHHQMAYGIGPKGVYLTNPLELVLEEVIREQLTSDSDLLVQRHDVISRWNAETDLGMLLSQQDPRWRQMNVLGQVVNILREARRPRVMGFRPQLTTHIRIPAWYRPGVSLFVRRDSEAYQLLRAAPDLPIKIRIPAEARPSAPRVSPSDENNRGSSECDGTKTNCDNMPSPEIEAPRTVTPPRAGTSVSSIPNDSIHVQPSTSNQDSNNGAGLHSDLNMTNDAQTSVQSVPPNLSPTTTAQGSLGLGAESFPRNEDTGEVLVHHEEPRSVRPQVEEANAGDMNVIPNSSNLPDNPR